MVGLITNWIFSTHYLQQNIQNSENFYGHNGHCLTKMFTHSKKHTIDPDTNTVDYDSEAIHYKWSWELNELFPNFHLKEFSDTVQDLQNTTNISFDYLKQAVECHVGLNKRLEGTLNGHQEMVDEKLANQHNTIFKSMDSYLDDIKNGGTQYEENIAHPNVLLYCIITACVIGFLFFVFKIFCTSTHSRKPLFPSYRMR